MRLCCRRSLLVPGPSLPAGLASSWCRVSSSPCWGRSLFPNSTRRTWHWPRRGCRQLRLSSRWPCRKVLNALSRHCLKSPSCSPKPARPRSLPIRCHLIFRTVSLSSSQKRNGRRVSKQRKISLSASKPRPTVRLVRPTKSASQSSCDSMNSSPASAAMSPSSSMVTIWTR